MHIVNFTKSSNYFLLIAFSHMMQSLLFLFYNSNNESGDDRILKDHLHGLFYFAAELSFFT